MTGAQRYTPAFLDQVRERVGLAELIGRTVKLQKRGREFVGCCPFHNEKTASFTVVAEKGFFHCFGCGAHGDVIGWVMRAESRAFPEAVEHLAAEAGLPLPEFDPAARAKAQRRATVLQAIEAAAAWFEEQLRGGLGTAGLVYLQKRGLDGEAIRTFRLGYAPSSGLRQALQAQGMDDALLLEAGLLSKGEDGHLFDMFRSRVVFPISDARGRVVGFGARTLGDDVPKYLNSRDSDAFHKGGMLYNLARARITPPAKQGEEPDGRVVVAEGYMDVIAFAQAGVPRAVAPLGTAMTEAQLQALWNIAPEPIVCLDGDTAGLRAARRLVDRALPLLAPGKSLRFALLPTGEDPDSLVRKSGRAGLAEVLAAALPMAEFLWQRLQAEYPADTPERRAGLRQALIEAAKRVGDPVVREYYRQALLEKFAGKFPPRGGRKVAPELLAGVDLQGFHPTDDDAAVAQAMAARTPGALKLLLRQAEAAAAAQARARMAEAEALNPLRGDLAAAQWRMVAELTARELRGKVAPHLPIGGLAVQADTRLGCGLVEHADRAGKLCLLVPSLDPKAPGGSKARPALRGLLVVTPRDGEWWRWAGPSAPGLGWIDGPRLRLHRTPLGWLQGCVAEAVRWHDELGQRQNDALSSVSEGLDAPPDLDELPGPEAVGMAPLAMPGAARLWLELPQAFDWKAAIKAGLEMVIVDDVVHARNLRAAWPPAVVNSLRVRLA